MEFKLPPRLHNEKGELRKVGFELEFGSIELDSVADSIIALFGGRHCRESNFLQSVCDTEIGEFQLKMDSRILTEKRYAGVLDTVGVDPTGVGMEDFVESVASWIIPYEIGMPPVAITDVGKLDKLRSALHLKKAKGTKASPINMYATHVNAEAPAMDAHTLLGYLRSFVLLYPALFEASEISFSRRLSSFIRPFPEEYVNLILDFSYAPDLERLILDYHYHNPDRNRPLDMYPVFGWLLPEIVGRMEDLGNVKPRPTFHYRLPNCLIDEAEWSLATEWNRWVAVERLASEENEMVRLASQYLELEADSFFGFSSAWAKQTAHLLG